MPKPRGKVDFWPSSGDWFWNIRAENGCIVADSAQGYSSKAKARQGFLAALKIGVEHAATIKPQARPAASGGSKRIVAPKTAKRRQRAT